MKIIFMGTPEFAVASLEEILNQNYTVVAVVTAPDKPAGRGQTIQQSAVKQFALKHNLTILQPDNLKSEEFIQTLKKLNADLQIVVAFRMLPEVVWNMPKHGTYNLHASLLPKYRGAAPINWAIINGDKTSGVTTFKLKHEIDTGNILFQSKVDILQNDTAGTLHDKLMHEGKILVIKTIQKIIECEKNNSELPFVIQNNLNASHAPKIFKQDCKINFELDAEIVNNFIRGLSPYPTAFTTIHNDDKVQTLKLFKTSFELDDNTFNTGAIISDNKTFLKIKCKTNLLTVYELQLEGKKRMLVKDFLKGYKIQTTAYCK